MKLDTLHCALLLPRLVLSPHPLIWQPTPSDWQVSQFIHSVESFALNSQSLHHSWTFFESILLSFERCMASGCASILLATLSIYWKIQL